MKIGDVVFDRDAKEYVKISNGTDDGEFVPTEARAIGFVGVTKDNLPMVAWTYRNVRSESLEEPTPWRPNTFEEYNLIVDKLRVERI